MARLKRFSQKALPQKKYIPGQGPHPGKTPDGFHFEPFDTRPLTPESALQQGHFAYALDLFNHGFYWETHEVLENLWQSLPKQQPSAYFLQGWIQLCAAHLKAKVGNARGVEKLLCKAEQNWAHCPPHFYGINLAKHLKISDNPWSPDEQSAYFPPSDLEQEIAHMTRVIESNPILCRALELAQELPDGWVGAGILFQNVWNLCHDLPQNAQIKDIDLLYYAPDLSWDAENQWIQRLQSQWDSPLELDIKNVARIHLWYPERFGVHIAPYPNVAASIAEWPVMGACMAVQKREEQLYFCAPYGFSDALALRVRPNPLLVNSKTYYNKALSWQQKWPKLQVWPWIFPQD